MFYDKTYLNNQITCLASTDYFDFEYNNSVDLSTNYYNKIETCNLLANEVSTTGDASISGNLEAQRLTLNKPSNDSETPLKITNNNQN